MPRTRSTTGKDSPASGSMVKAKTSERHLVANVNKHESAKERSSGDKTVINKRPLSHSKKENNAGSEIPKRRKAETPSPKQAKSKLARAKTPLKQVAKSPAGGHVTFVEGDQEMHMSVQQGDESYCESSQSEEEEETGK